MKHELILPSWLDDLVFKKFKAVYHPCPDEVQYGPDQGLEHVLTYLGTYFPRSFTEAYCIVEHLLLNEKYKDILDGLEEINVFDFCCGTGGELFGAIMAFQTYLPNLKRINIDAFDANRWAVMILTRIYNEYLPKVSELHVEVNLTLNPVFVENEQYLQDVSNMLNRNYHLILSFKALNEFIQGETFKLENVYSKIAKTFSPRLDDNGVLLLLDVSSRHKKSGVYYPEILNQGIKEFVNSSDEFKTIIPHSCYYREDSCPSCYMQDIFRVSHSGIKYDKSKVVYRILCRKKFANQIMMKYLNIPACRATVPAADKSIPYQDL